MLDRVERRGFLVEPTREHPLPAAVGALHVELHEGAGQLLKLPRRRRLAGAQPHHGILDAHRLPRLQPDVAHDAVALVEQAEDRDSLGHRRHSGLVGREAGRLLDDRRALLSRLLLRALRAIAAGARHGRRDQENCRATHAQSGVQGW